MIVQNDIILNQRKNDAFRPQKRKHDEKREVGENGAHPVFATVLEADGDNPDVGTTAEVPLTVVVFANSPCPNCGLKFTVEHEVDTDVHGDVSVESDTALSRSVLKNTGALHFASFAPFSTNQ